MGIIQDYKNLPQQQKQQHIRIGWMCFFWSMASLMVFTLLPIFLKKELNMSHSSIGMIDGISVFLAFVSKVMMGGFSDILKSRRKIIIVGNAMSMIIKPMFALTSYSGAIFLAKAIDRFSKGIRSAPTDALIGDWTTPETIGMGYGIRHTLYALGAVVGSMLTSQLYKNFSSFRLIFWLSFFPAFFAFLISIFLIKDSKILTSNKRSWSFKDVTSLPRPFWLFMIGIFFLMMARFSESFLTLRAKEIGFETHHLPLLFLIYEFTNFAIAFPMGYLADKLNRVYLLMVGIIVLCVCDIFFFISNSQTSIVIGFALCGIHLGSTQGLMATIVSSFPTAHMRGTAFTIFYLVTGVGVYMANFMAGYFSDLNNTTSPAFQYGLAMSIISIAILWFQKKKIIS
jgi:MFS family permease